MWSNLSKTFRYVNDNGDSITLDYEHGYLINKPVGIDTITVNLSQAQGINQVGATIQSVTVQPRPVTISGRLCGEYQVKHKNDLLSVIRPDIGGKLFADDYYLVVRPTQTPTITAETEYADFQFQLLAPYPYWLQDEYAKATLSGVKKGFKFPWNISQKYRFGTVLADAFINIHNGGQVPIPFTVTYTAVGEVTNPKITDASTGKFLLLNKSLVPGERVVIEITHERTYATSSVSGECRGRLSLKNTLNRLNVGDNVLKPEADGGLGNLQVDIKYSTEIVGVTV